MPDAPVAPGAVVGFVGLGNMGAPMASLMSAAGYAVQGFDVHEGARAAFAAQSGRSAAGSLAQAASDARVVVLMLPNSEVVEDVLLAGGLLDAVPDGALIVDMSSSDPTRTLELADEAERRGRGLVDAPVSGGVVGARNGTLTIMVGGREDQFAAVEPLLGTMGRKVLHVGGVAAGHAMKALNNLLSGSTLLITSEAVSVARRFGLDPELMVDVINGSSGRSYSTEHKFPDFVFPGNYGSGFGVRLQVKDMRIALELARATGVPVPFTEASVELWERAMEALPADADHTEIARWVEAGGDGR